MLVLSDNDIFWSKEDTFDLPITHKKGFEEGTKLKFEVSENENFLPVISNTYELISRLTENIQL